MDIRIKKVLKTEKKPKKPYFYKHIHLKGIMKKIFSRYLLKNCLQMNEKITKDRNC